jgi:hypothetical protein
MTEKMKFRYLCKSKDGAFFTNYYDAENHHFEGLTVFDLQNEIYSDDGKEWKQIEYDTL